MIITIIIPPTSNDISTEKEAERRQMTKVIPVLSFGMGVESTALLLRWLHEPQTRNFDLKDLIVITSQVGEEYEDTRAATEEFVLPLLRAHGVRFVQVARAGHHQADGIEILSDTRTPTNCLTDGAYKLSDELKASGTVPQFGGEHRCSLKFKAFVIESWLNTNVSGSIHHAFGYNSEELRRVEKSEQAIARVAFGFNADETTRALKGAKYDTPLRQGWYPLVEWGWSRQDCKDYIKTILDVDVQWMKSACVFCPFNKMTTKNIERHRQHPNQVADAMLLEYASLSANPRGQLYKNTSLIELTTINQNAKALEIFTEKLSQLPWAVYRVRRIYTKKGKAHRCIEVEAQGSHDTEMIDKLRQVATDSELSMESQHGIKYAYVRRRGDQYPSVEEYYVASIGTIAAKTRYGMDWFEDRWEQTLGNMYCGPDDYAEDEATTPAGRGLLQVFKGYAVATIGPQTFRFQNFQILEGAKVVGSFDKNMRGDIKGKPFFLLSTGQPRQYQLVYEEEREAA